MDKKNNVALVNIFIEQACNSSMCEIVESIQGWVRVIAYRQQIFIFFYTVVTFHDCPIQGACLHVTVCRIY